MVDRTRLKALYGRLHYLQMMYRIDMRGAKTDLAEAKNIAAQIHLLIKGDTMDEYRIKTVDTPSSGAFIKGKNYRGYGAISNEYVAQMFANKLKAKGVIYVRANHTIYVPAQENTNVGPTQSTEEKTDAGGGHEEPRGDGGTNPSVPETESGTIESTPIQPAGNTPDEGRPAPSPSRLQLHPKPKPESHKPGKEPGETPVPSGRQWFRMDVD